MGITDKINQVIASIQVGAKNTSTSLFGWAVKIITAFMIGIILAMIGQEMMSYGTFSFVFVLAVTLAALIRIMMTWSVGTVVIFDLVCVLVALLLRMYILVAP